MGWQGSALTGWRARCSNALLVPRPPKHSPPTHTGPKDVVQSARAAGKSRWARLGLLARTAVTQLAQTGRKAPYDSAATPQGQPCAAVGRVRRGAGLRSRSWAHRGPPRTPASSKARFSQVEAIIGARRASRRLSISARAGLGKAVQRLAGMESLLFSTLWPPPLLTTAPKRYLVTYTTRWVCAGATFVRPR